MQGQRTSVGSLSEALNFETGSTSSNAAIDQQIRWNNNIQDLNESELQDYMISPTDTNITFANSIYHEQRDLNRFSIGDASSSGTKNEFSSHDEQKMENDSVDLNPLFVQPSSSNQVAQNLNLNSEFIGHGDDNNQVMGHSRSYESNMPVNERVSLARIFEENGGRPGSSSLEGRRASCKRKALECSVGQPSSSNGGIQRGESSSWAPGPAYYNPGHGLNIPGTLEQASRGLNPSAIPGFPVPIIAESSRRNFRVTINPLSQPETLNPGIFSAGSVVRRPVAPSLPHSSRSLPVDQHHLDLRSGTVLSNVVSQNQNLSSAIHVPAIPRNIHPPIRWNGVSNSLVGGSSSSVVSIDRNVVQRDETRSRSVSRNILDNPLFFPAPELRNLAHNPTTRSLNGGNINIPGNVGSNTSRVGSATRSNNPTRVHSGHNNPPNNQRRYTELVRRSLLSSRGAEPGNPGGGDHPMLRFSVPPASPEEVLLPSGGGNNSSQEHSRNYARTASWLERQGDSVIGIPHSLRVLASASRGRSRLIASEIRNVLDLMRRGENLRFEDIMLLDQSVFSGIARIHDRYRDMRLDVDNMTYEELLALEERIGDVCTGLNEETISNLLKHTSHNGSQQDAEPCCICQEEYNGGEDLGTLECGHGFHTDCIKQWLKHKNICPICKTTGLNSTEKPSG